MKRKAVLHLVTLFAALSSARAQQNGDIRLSNGTQTKGRLEVFLGGKWGTVCYDSSQSQLGVAQVACRQLGHNNFEKVDTLKNMKLPAGNLSALLSAVSCTYETSKVQNAAQHILRCKYSTGQSSCSQEPLDAMGIECATVNRTSFPYDTMVDIQNEDISPRASVSSGFAQVYLNNQWGPVCNMGKADADTLCLQLSYTGAVDVYNKNLTSNHPVEVLDTFKCSSSQTCLRHCFNYPRTNTKVKCDSGYSFVTCTYNTAIAKDQLYGTKSFCTATNKSGVILGCLLAAAVVLCASICLSCWVYRITCFKRRRRTYQVIS